MALSKEALERIKKNKENLINGNLRNPNNSGNNKNTTGSTTVSSGSNSGGGSTLSQSAKERIKANKAKITNGSLRYSPVDNAYINAFITDANRYATNYSKKYGNLDYNTVMSDSFLKDIDSMKVTEQDLRSRARQIQEFLYNNRGEIDADASQQLGNFANSFNSFNGVNRLSSARDSMSKYKNEDEYNAAVRQSGWQQEYQGMDYLKLRDEAAKLEPGSEKREWLNSYKYSALTGNDIDKAMAEVNREVGSLSNFIDQWGNLDVWYNDYMVNPGAASFDLTEEEVQERLAMHKAIMNRFGSYDGMRNTLKSKKEELWNLENHKQYGLLEENEDFYDVSKAVSVDPTAGFGIQLFDKFYGSGDEVYDYINDIGGAQKNMSENGGEGLYYKYSFMEPEEKARYNYLFHKEGEDSAYKYLEYLEPTLNARLQGERREEVAAWTKEAGGWASAVSVPASLLSIVGIADVIGQAAGNWWHEFNTGEYAGPIDYNTPFMTPAIISSTIRGERAAYYNSLGTIKLDENFVKEHPIISKIINGKGWGDVYQLGMSMVDSAATAGLAKIGIPGASALLGGAAGTQGMLDALERGATDEQAIWMGVLNGTFEMLFEAVSIDKLINGDPKSLISAILVQGGVEASEETLTSVANLFADCIIMAEKSDLSIRIAEYLKEHPDWTEEQARKQAILDVAIQIGWDAVGGFLSGGIMGGGSYAIESGADFYSTTKQKIEDFNKTYSADPGALVDEVLEVNPDNKFAQRMQGRLDDGKKLSIFELNRLVHQNEKAITAQDMATIQSAAEARLTELGETGDVAAIAAALTKQAAGKKLTKAEQKVIAESKRGQRVAEEMDKENIKAGTHSSAWAEKLDTNRINVEEYSRLVEAAQLPQEAAETTGGKVVTDTPKAAQVQQAGAVANKTGTEDPSPTLRSAQGDSVSSAEEPKAKAVTLEKAAERYGAQAQAMIHTYQAGQDVEKFDNAYRLAYNWGQSGVSPSYMNRLMDENAELSGSDKIVGNVVRYLTKEQAQLAYEAGAAASDTSARALEDKNTYPHTIFKHLQSWVICEHWHIC